MLKAADLTVKQGTRMLCQQLNIEMKPHQIWGVLGPNGSGKTTLIHTLAGLRNPAAGNILLEDQPLRRLTRQAIAQKIGLLFQETNMHFPQTVWEYCLAGRYPHLSRFKQLKQLDHDIVTNALIQMDLFPLRHLRLQQLSGGEKRRASLAALIAQQPAIYLLDEPTNHLDLKHQVTLLRHLQILAKSKAISVMMILHDINLAQRFCDYILLMSGDGNCLKGTCDQMLTRDNLSNIYQYPMTARQTRPFWHAEIE